MHQKGNEYIYSIYQSVSEECKLKEDWEKTWLYIRSVKYISYGRLCPARREFPVQAKLQIRWWMFNVRKNVILVGFSANYVSFLLQNLIFTLYRSITNKYLSLSCIYTILIVFFCSLFYSIVFVHWNWTQPPMHWFLLISCRRFTKCDTFEIYTQRADYYHQNSPVWQCCTQNAASGGSTEEGAWSINAAEPLSNMRATSGIPG